jgi:hypothetical protein
MTPTPQPQGQVTVPAGTRQRSIVVPLGRPLTREELTDMLADYLHPDMIDVRWVRGCPVVTLTGESHFANNED